MYSFAQRTDTTVVDEPLYAHYLTSTDADEYHPGAEEVIADQENDGEKVIQDVIFGNYDSPVIFFKNMTHHLVNLDKIFLKETINVILTRDPRDMLPSFINQIKRPKITDTGYPQHLDLLNYLISIGQKPIILDSKDILRNPEQKLKWLCDQMKIPFDTRMLSWRAGARKEDGIWAKHWYHNVHKSTGFQPYKNKKKIKAFPEDLLPLLAECELLYHELIGRGRALRDM